MLGGGVFTTQNKVLPGSYINFVSAANASADIGDRGYAALALGLSWGADDTIFTVTGEDFRSNCLKIFGFSYDSDEAKGLRDLFRNIRTLYCYKLMKNGVAATNSIAKAKYKGIKGNSISTEILAGTTSGTFDANIYFGNSLVYSANVRSAEDLKAVDNGFVEWTIDTVEATERASMSGGSDGDEVTAEEHTAFLNAAEGYSFNAMGCLSTEKAIQELYIQEVKDMRDNAGIKYQLVVFNNAADHEAVVNVKNSVDAVWWTTGVIAGCEVNKSNTNKVYDGEFDIPVSYTQAQLETAIKAGEFAFHQVGQDIRVLTDINSLVTTTAEKGEDFKSNQTIRVIDQIAMDIASIFNTKYIGQIPNNQSGRVSLWNDIVSHHQALETLGAIEAFDSSNVVVEQGNTKKSVVVSDVITVTNSMEQLYMQVVID
jgi:hypothetical protein